MFKRFLIKRSAPRVGEIKENNFDSAASGNRGRERRRTRGMKCCSVSNKFLRTLSQSLFAHYLIEEAVWMPQFRFFFRLKFSCVILSFVQQFREIVPCFERVIIFVIFVTICNTILNARVDVSHGTQWIQNKWKEITLTPFYERSRAQVA